MRLHIVSLPHTHTTADWLSCAYTQKVVKAGKMFTDAGHEVYIYSGEYNEAVCHEHIPCLSEAERASWYGKRDANDINFGGIAWDARHPGWATLNERAAAAILERARPRDFVLILGGNCQAPLAHAVQPLKTLEFGVGYEGVFTGYRAFESAVWRHWIYGRLGESNGHWYDAVIPNYFDPDDFPEDLVGKKDGYLLFIGRITARKGPHIAAQIANHLGIPLLVAGGGATEVTPLDGGGCKIQADGIVVEGPMVEYVGPVGPERRAELMAGAIACLVPTLYVEPFGGVAVEAMLAGTPAVTSDFGAFVETVELGVSGYRFSSFGEGVEAVQAAMGLEPETVRAYALGRYSLEAVAPLFDEWFARIDNLWRGGWDEPPLPAERQQDAGIVPLLTSGSAVRRRLRAMR